MKLTALLATGAIVAFVGAGAQQPVQPPAFRAGTDLVQVDVSVLDKHRKPVSGLTAADFTVFEDGKPRPIVAFTSVDLANLTVHAFDPNGLQTLAISAGSTVRGRGAPGAVAGNIQSTLVRQGNLGVLPDHTGGRTVLNTNEPGAEMRDVFRESHSGSASQPRNVEMLVTAFSPT